MGQYLFSVTHSGHDAIPEGVAVEQMFADVGAFNDRLEAEGRMVFAGGLKQEADVADASRGTVTDGRYSAELPCQQGLWVVRARDMDEAKELALAASRCCRVPVEVRPFEDMPDD